MIIKKAHLALLVYQWCGQNNDHVLLCYNALVVIEDRDWEERLLAQRHLKGDKQA
jgi:hypothetical protein